MKRGPRGKPASPLLPRATRPRPVRSCTHGARGSAPRCAGHHDQVASFLRASAPVRVRRPLRDQHGRPGGCQHDLVAEAEAERPVEDVSGLVVLGVHVQAGDRALLRRVRRGAPFDDDEVVACELSAFQGLGVDCRIPSVAEGSTSQSAASAAVTVSGTSTRPRAEAVRSDGRTWTPRAARHQR